MKVKELISFLQEYCDAETEIKVSVDLDEANEVGCGVVKADIWCISDDEILLKNYSKRPIEKIPF